MLCLGEQEEPRGLQEGEEGVFNSTLGSFRELPGRSDVEFRMKMSLSDREGLQGENIPDGFEQGNNIPR